MVPLIPGSANISIYSVMRSIGSGADKSISIKEVSTLYRHLFYWEGSDLLSLFVC